MRILLVDDHVLVRDGIASLLKASSIHVVGEASDGLEALEKARQLNPDVILMDIKMPGCNGLEATRLIKAEMPEIKVIALSVSDDDEDLFEAIKSGAEGYLLKNIRGERFVALLTGVVQGEAAISPVLAARIIDEFARQGSAGSDTSRTHGNLTPKEEEVLRWVAGGTPNKEMATALSVSENTIKYHLRNIMAKLRLRNRTQMAAYAASKGITGYPPPSTG